MNRNHRGQFRHGPYLQQDLARIQSYEAGLTKVHGLRTAFMGLCQASNAMIKVNNMINDVNMDDCSMNTTLIHELKVSLVNQLDVVVPFSLRALHIKNKVQRKPVDEVDFKTCWSATSLKQIFQEQINRTLEDIDIQINHCTSEADACLRRILDLRTNINHFIHEPSPTSEGSD